MRREILDTPDYRCLRRRRRRRRRRFETWQTFPEIYKCHRHRHRNYPPRRPETR